MPVNVTVNVNVHVIGQTSLTVSETDPFSKLFWLSETSGILTVFGGYLESGYRNPKSCAEECQKQKLLTGKNINSTIFFGLATTSTNETLCSCGLDWELHKDKLGMCGFISLCKVWLR